MIKSPLLKRIIILVLSTILISAGITAGIYMFVAKNTFVKIRATELLPAAQNIASYISSTWDGTLDSKSLPFFDSNFKVLDAQVHLYDASGNIVKYDSNSNDSDDTSEPDDDQTKNSFYKSPKLNNSENSFSAIIIPWINQSTKEEQITIITNTIKQIVAQKAQINETQSVLSDIIPQVLSKNTINTIIKSSKGNDYLVVAVPIINNGSVIGAVAFAKPIREFTAAINGLTLTLLLSMLASFLVMLIPSYFASTRIVVPIRQMRDVSLSIAEGDYSTRADETQKGEIGELAKALNKCSIESEHLEQTRRDYVANVSHELRTPIASIRAIAETLKDGLVKDETKKENFYNSILNESMRLSALVDDLLELSRLQSGTTPFEKDKFSIYELLKNSSEIHLTHIEQKNLNFKFEIPKDTPYVFSNPDRIEQVFVIMLDNAIKHTGSGGSITLSARWDDEKVYISLKDTGEGISNEDMEHIFDRFYKADKAHSSQGTGLGLSIAKEVLTLLDEKIEAQSTLGEGAIFTFTLTRSASKK